MIHYPTPLAPRSVDRHFRRSVDRHFRTAPRPRADASRAQAGPRPQQIPQGTTLATTPRRSPPQNQHRRPRAASGRLVRSSRSGQPLGPLRPYILAPPLLRLSPALQAQLCRAGTAQLAPLHAPLRAPPSSTPSSSLPTILNLLLHCLQYRIQYMIVLMRRESRSRERAVAIGGGCTSTRTGGSST